jgi:hypothetical protein
MTDAATNERLVVEDDPEVGPFLRAPLSRLDDIQARLDRHGIDYWLDETAIALDGKNFITYVNFGRRGSAAAAQAALDGPDGAPDAAGR